MSHCLSGICNRTRVGYRVLASVDSKYIPLARRTRCSNRVQKTVEGVLSTRIGGSSVRAFAQATDQLEMGDDLTRQCCPSDAETLLRRLLTG